MTTKQLNGRVDRLRPSSPRPTCIRFEPGESKESIHRRAAAVGYPVVIVPRRCKTTEEWLSLYAPKPKDQPQ